MQWPMLSDNLCQHNAMATACSIAETESADASRFTAVGSSDGWSRLRMQWRTSCFIVAQMQTLLPGLTEGAGMIADVIAGGSVSSHVPWSMSETQNCASQDCTQPGGPQQRGRCYGLGADVLISRDNELRHHVQCGPQARLLKSDWAHKHEYGNDQLANNQLRRSIRDLSLRCCVGYGEEKSHGRRAPFIEKGTQLPRDTVLTNKD